MDINGCVAFYQIAWNLEEILPMYYMHSDACNKLNFQSHSVVLQLLSSKA